MVIIVCGYRLSGQSEGGEARDSNGEDEHGAGLSLLQNGEEWLYDRELPCLAR